MPSASAIVATDRPTRYIKQLVSHFGTKVETTLIDEGASIRFAFGTCDLVAAPGGIRLAAVASGVDDLSRLKDVVARHLVRFGTKDELVVEWVDVQPGQVLAGGL